MAAVTSHRESVLKCGAPKESPKSTASAIPVRLTLHLGVDLGSDYLLTRRPASRA